MNALEQSQYVPATQWSAATDATKKRAEIWTKPYRRRRAAGEMHPIHDFLFIYFRFAPASLEAWHPGLGVILENSPHAVQFNEKYYSHAQNRIFLDPSKIDTKIRKRLNWSLRLCKAIRGRPAQFGCYGLHEWAMVYKGGPDGRARHEGSLPMRLPQAEIDRVIEKQSICCSHFDAFRFFTKSAMPFNKLQPTQDTRTENEQAGCLHTNMDLYKWAAKCAPWISSELVWDTFIYAVKCRELDMRASPYDCTSLGYAPVMIETTEGRKEYEHLQRTLSEQAKPLRDRLIHALTQVLSA